MTANDQEASHESKRCRLSHESTIPVPTEVLHLIFDYLEFHDLLSVSQVSRSWNIAASARHLWRRCTLKLHQDIKCQLLPGHNQRSLSTTVGNNKNKFHQRDYINSRYHPMATVWILKTTETLIDIRLTYPLACDLFLRRNAMSPRLGLIQSLSLVSAGDIVTSHFLRQLLMCLPNLRTVDLSCCQLLSDIAIKNLVSGGNRRQTLESVTLRKCFGLSHKSVRHISTYCHNLRYLDISEGCGAAELPGLLNLFRLARYPRLEDTSELEDEDEDDRLSIDDIAIGETIPDTGKISQPPRIIATLETLCIAASDYLSEADLILFFRLMGDVPECQLSTVNLARNFNVTPTVLNAIFTNRRRSNLKQSLKLDVRGCDQLASEDVLQTKHRLQSTGGWQRVEILENCRIQDYSYESIRSFLHDLTASA